MKPTAEDLALDLTYLLGICDQAPDGPWSNDRNSRLYAVLPEAVPAENVAVRHSANATANSKPKSS